MRSLAVVVIFACPMIVACGNADSIPAPRHAPAPVAPEVSPPPAPQPVAVAPAPAPAKSDADALRAAELDAYAQARPVFDRYCATCHTTGGAKATPKKLDHFAMDSYPFGGHHARVIGATVREVLGVDGAEATMPPKAPGSVQGPDLDAIVAWSRAFDAAEQAGLHDAAPDHAHHHHSSR